VRRSDRDLLSAWRAGDRHAGSELFERYFDGVFRFFRNKVDHAASDLVQRTFMACVEGRDRFRGDSTFRTFVFAVARNVLREHIRERQRALRREIDFELDSIVDLGSSPVTRLAARAEEKLLLQALRALPLAAQEVLELYYWERLTGAELAAVLGVPEDTARSRVRRARGLLEETLARLEASPRELESTLSGLDQWAAGLRDRLGPGRA